MADTSISLLKSAATPTFAQPAATGAGTASGAPLAVGAAPAAGTPGPMTGPPAGATGSAQAATQQQATAAATNQPKDPGPVELEPGTDVHTLVDTMGWLQGQMARPRVQASASQSASLEDLNQRLLTAYQTVMGIWATDG